MQVLRKILVIDDNAENLDILGLVFEDEGYSVAQLNNADLLFDHIATFQPNIILMDVMLGNANGIDVCNTIKTTPSSSHIKVVLMTASHAFLNLDKEKCLADGYIPKPFDIDEVVAVANALI